MGSWLVPGEGSKGGVDAPKEELGGGGWWLCVCVWGGQLMRSGLGPRSGQV